VPARPPGRFPDGAGRAFTLRTWLVRGPRSAVARPRRRQQRPRDRPVPSPSLKESNAASGRIGWDNRRSGRGCIRRGSGPFHGAPRLVGPSRRLCRRRPYRRGPGRIVKTRSICAARSAGWPSEGKRRRKAICGAGRSYCWSCRFRMIRRICSLVMLSSMVLRNMAMCGSSKDCRASSLAAAMASASSWPNSSAVSALR
jgi:hypothetical protein